MFMTFTYHLTSADVLINCIRCSGCGWGPVQFHCGSARFAEWAPLQSSSGLDNPFQKQVTHGRNFLMTLF